MSAQPARPASSLSRQWIGRLSSYRDHRNDEHREALIDEAARFVGFHLESDLTTSAYWSVAPLSRRIAVLLFLVDRGAVVRVSKKGRVVYEATASAETWAASQLALAPYLDPTLELISALRHAQARRLSMPD